MEAGSLPLLNRRPPGIVCTLLYAMNAFVGSVQEVVEVEVVVDVDDGNDPDEDCVVEDEAAVVDELAAVVDDVVKVVCCDETEVVVN